MEEVCGYRYGGDIAQVMDKSCSISYKEYPNKPCDARPPERFSDPSTIVPPSSLQELIATLHEIFASDEVSVEYVQTLMASYKSNRAEWKKFAKADPHRYTRNLIDEGNGKFNLMLLCWNEGQGSGIHSHANSHCFLKVLSGNIRERLYEWPTDATSSSQHEEECEEDGHSKGDSYSTMKQREELEFGANACTYINDSLGLHRVENSSHVDMAITLHLYSPPFQACQCFDERTGRATTSAMTFWSKHGKRTPFGRDQDKLPSKMEAENN